MKKEYIIYKHRDLKDGEKEWRYSFFHDEGRLYRGPYHSIDELAENLSAFSEIMQSRLRSMDEMIIASGTQISPVSEDELAKIYFQIIKKKQMPKTKKVLVQTN